MIIFFLKAKKISKALKKEFKKKPLRVSLKKPLFFGKFNSKTKKVNFFSTNFNLL